VKFGFAPRPIGGNSNIDPKLLAAIEETAVNGQSVVIEEFEVNFLTWQQKMRTAMFKRGYKVKFRQIKHQKQVICWASKITEDDEDLDEVEDDASGA